MDETIKKESIIGDRLSKIIKEDNWAVLFDEKKIPIISKITLGRDRSNDIVVNDKMCSRQHAVIQKIDKEYFIKDLGSTNGTFVNNVQVPNDKYMKISPGDEISLGKTKLKITFIDNA